MSGGDSGEQRSYPTSAALPPKAGKSRGSLSQGRALQWPLAAAGLTIETGDSAQCPRFVVLDAVRRQSHIKYIVRLLRAISLLYSALQTPASIEVTGLQITPLDPAQKAIVKDDVVVGGR